MAVRCVFGLGAGGVFWPTSFVLCGLWCRLVNIISVLTYSYSKAENGFLGNSAGFEVYEGDKG